MLHLDAGSFLTRRSFESQLIDAMNASGMMDDAGDAAEGAMDEAEDVADEAAEKMSDG